jgi:sec-independent protein translocase protein TatC
MSQPDTDQEMPLVAHLVELRNRLLWVIGIIIAIFGAMMPFASQIYAWFASPLLSQLPSNSQMIAIEVASPFLIPFKFTFIVAIVLAAPFVLYQIWAFVAPGLYRHEKNMVWPLLVSSTLLFYMGVAFAFFLVFPMMFHFITSSGPEGVAVMTDISKYLDFSLAMFLAFGLAFEVPVAVVLLVSMGILSPESMNKHRPYVILGAFIIGMLLTPADPMSMTMLALPIWWLFEAGVLVSKLIVRRKARESAVARQP